MGTEAEPWSRSTETDGSVVYHRVIRARVASHVTGVRALRPATEEDPWASSGPGTWLIMAAVFVVLFGSKKLPDAARSIGRSMRIFKAETKGLREDDDKHRGRSRQSPPPRRRPSRHPASSPTSAGSASPTTAARQFLRPLTGP